jgi:hypothetical protein
MTNIVLIALISMMPRVSWAGHLGGGLVGALIGIPLNMAHFDTGVRRWLGWGGAAAAVVLGFVLLQVGLGGRVNEVERSELEIQRAWNKEVAMMWRADEVVRTNVKNVAINPKWPGDAEAAKIVSTYRETKKKVETALAELKSLGPFRSPELVNNFKTGIAMLELVVPYCDRVANALQSKETWTNQEQATLRADFAKIDEARIEYRNAYLKMKSVGEGNSN